MTTITRADIRTRVRMHADLPNSNQGKLDTAVNMLIDDACAEYYDLLVSVRGQEYFQNSGTLPVTSGTATYSLPSDFYQLISATIEWATDDHEVLSAITSEREAPRFTNLVTWDRGSPKGFRVRGVQGGTQTFALYPTPRTACTIRVRYVPTYTAFTADTGAGGTIDCVNAWWTLIVFKVAAQLRGLLGLPNDHLRNELEMQLKRVTEMATERLADEPARIVDVQPEELTTWYPRHSWFRVS